MLDLPFCLGATSYVVDGDLVENAAYLAAQWRGIIGDMQLVLFDLVDGPSNLPGRATAAALAAIGRATGLGYTVHLLQDLAAADEGGAAESATAESWARAHAVMARTKTIGPRAYVAHLDGSALRTSGYHKQAAWTEGMAHTLRRVGLGCAGVHHLVVENLEGYPPDLVEGAVVASGAARCVDVGHLWLEGHDPLPWLDAATNLRVIHLHGVGHDAARGRVADHLALDRTPIEWLDAVCRWLNQSQYAGVVTLEVFGQDDFLRSVAALQASWQRVTGAG